MTRRFTRRVYYAIDLVPRSVKGSVALTIQCRRARFVVSPRSTVESLIHINDIARATLRQLPAIYCYLGAANFRTASAVLPRGMRGLRSMRLRIVG